MDRNLIAIAFAREEGWFVKGSIPQLCSNPGDLELGDIGYGVIKGKTVFANAILGWQALYEQINRMLSGTDPLWPPTMTLAEAGMRYSGGDPQWAINVALELGVPETATLEQLATK